MEWLRFSPSGFGYPIRDAFDGRANRDAVGDFVGRDGCDTCGDRVSSKEEPGAIQGGRASRGSELRLRPTP